MDNRCKFCNDEDPAIFIFVGGYGFNDPELCCCHRRECAEKLGIRLIDIADGEAERIAEIEADQ